MFGSSVTETGTMSAQGSMSDELTVGRPTVREKEAPTPGEPLLITPFIFPSSHCCLRVLV